MTITLSYNGIGLVVLICGGLLWLLGFVFFKYYLPSKIESAVKAKYEKELESYKHELAIVAAQRNLRYSYVYAKTADVLQGFYIKLDHCFTKLYHAISNNASSQIKETLDTTRASSDDFFAYFNSNSLYFPIETDDVVTKSVNIMSEMNGVFRDKIFHYERTGEWRSWGIEMAHRNLTEKHCEHVKIVRKTFQVVLGISTGIQIKKEEAIQESESLR